MAAGPPCGASRAAFTIVEMMLGFAIVSAILFFSMSMYTSGNKSSAKAAWRVHTTGKMRTALRQIKDRLEAASYPSVIRVSDYFEPDPVTPWVLDMATPSSTTPGGAGSMATATFDGTGDIVTFYMCLPRRELEAGVTPGRARRVLLRLDAGRTIPANKTLVMHQEDADVTLSGTAVQVGGFGPTALVVPGSSIWAAHPADTTLLLDVESVVLGWTDTALEKSVLHLTVNCKDPYDGRFKLSETVRANMNVRIQQ